MRHTHTVGSAASNLTASTCSANSVVDIILLSVENRLNDDRRRLIASRFLPFLHSFRFLPVSSIYRDNRAHCQNNIAQVKSRMCVFGAAHQLAVMTAANRSHTKLGASCIYMRILKASSRYVYAPCIGCSWVGGSAGSCWNVAASRKASRVFTSSSTTTAASVHSKRTHYTTARM